MIEISRETKETQITIALDINGNGITNIDTGIGFFDHMLNSLAFWAGWELTIKCNGDLYIDSHHTVEDIGLTLGKAFFQSWQDAPPFHRISHAFCPLDEALCRVVVDICNRPFTTFEADFDVERVGQFETAMTGHFFRSFAQEGRITLHIKSLYGKNSHHIIETLFKGTGMALRRALQPLDNSVRSTKGIL